MLNLICFFAFGFFLVGILLLGIETVHTTRKKRKAIEMLKLSRTPRERIEKLQKNKGSSEDKNFEKPTKLIAQQTSMAAQHNKLLSKQARQNNNLQKFIMDTMQVQSRENSQILQLLLQSANNKQL